MTAGQLTWITADDGTPLCTTVYRPGGDGPWPALIEALPYRMHDVTASYGEHYVELAAAGFAVCRVDLRGTGSSGGIASDEYPDVERTDLRTVIGWLAAQPWCTGRVGMFGTSYSGFNSLHMAAEGISELGAVIAFYATDDRYTDDVHHSGGVLRAIDLVDYVTYMVAMNALPPVPAVWGDGGTAGRGESWDQLWRRRVDETPAWVLDWLRQQVDGPMWRRGSIRTGPDGAGYERISCPTMIVAGWADGYRNNTFRTVERLGVPWRLLVGPWSHADPARARPGPNIDATVEMITFFAEHLGDGPPSTDAAAQIFVRQPVPPEPDLAAYPGIWRDAETWPPPDLGQLVLTPLGDDAVAELDVRPDVGVAAWNSCAGGLPWGQPSDQRDDDAHSLTYEWPIDTRREVVGNPTLSVRVRASAPVAHLGVKLCDVFPDGTSALITRAMFNLTHRGCWPVDAGGAVGRAPSAVVPDEWMDIDVALEATTWTLLPGHRLRLAIAGTDWPNCWPPPAPVRLGVDRASIELRLPVWDGAPETTHAFRPGTGPSDEPDDGLVWRIEHDVLARQTRAVTRYGGRYTGEHGAVVDDVYEGTVGVSTVDPGDAWAEGHCHYRIAWPEATCETDATLTVRSNAEAYDVTIELTATRDGEPFGSRRWTERIRRQLQ